MKSVTFQTLLLIISVVFVHHEAGAVGTTTRVSLAADGTPADSASFAPTLSADGRFVAFESSATNLVPGDTNGEKDVFVRDRRLNQVAVTDLALAATATPDPVQHEQTLTYAFTLTNQGPDRATGTSLLAVLSSHLLVTAVTPSQGDCQPAHVLVCRLGPLPPETTATVTVNATVQSTAPESLGTTASALANERDPDQANNHLLSDN
jgi:uncharacterized repeat protein (TIGR01451 family)